MSTEASLLEEVEGTPRWIDRAGQTVIWSDCQVTLNEQRGDRWVGLVVIGREGIGSLP